MRNPFEGKVDLFNIVNKDLPSVVECSAIVGFYAFPFKKSQLGKATNKKMEEKILDQNGRIPDLVIPLGEGCTNCKFPTKISGAYLNIFAQPQIDDEFYWSCLPSNVSSVN